MATDITTPPLGAQTTQETNLSTWAGPYITDMLGKSQALAELPYRAYTADIAGAYQPIAQQLTAGPSALQTKAFEGLGSLTVPSALGTAASQAQQTYGATQQYMPTVGTVESYMNPYLEAVLAPQRRIAEETAAKQRMETAGRLSQAGAYGGSRQAIMEAEGQKNLQQLLSDITGKGYAGAYDVARAQRQADIQAGLQGIGAQTAATQALAGIGGQQQAAGIQNIQQQLAAGQTQRDIEQAGLAKAYEQFLREEQYPKEQLQFQRQMISGIPGLATQSYYTSATDPFMQAAQGATSLMGLLAALGIIK